MKINCVVVTYNRLSLLKECLSALENQTYPIQRIVIVDNCSTDGTSEFLDSLTGYKVSDYSTPKKILVVLVAFH